MERVVSWRSGPTYVMLVNNTRQGIRLPRRSHGREIGEEVRVAGGNLSPLTTMNVG